MDALLDLNRLQAGQLTLEQAPVDVRALIDQSIAESLPAAERKRLRLVRDVPEALPITLADGRRLNQVFGYLIDNAIKFTPEEGTIAVRAGLQGDGLLVEVKDSGIGLSDPEITTLFQRFNQVDTSFTRASGGLGLGLATSKGLVEAHGGEIGVRSEPGLGSTFWFTLPLSLPLTLAGREA